MFNQVYIHIVFNSVTIFDTFYSLKLVSSQNFSSKVLWNSVIGAFGANYNKFLVNFLFLAHCVAFEKLVSELHEFFFQVTLGGKGADLSVKNL